MQVRASTPSLFQQRSALLRSFTMDRLMTTLMMSITVMAGLCVEVQSDTWWQLRSGQYILASRSIPTTEPWSSTVRGGYWPNHEWLAEVLFYGLFSLGGLPMMIVASAAMLGAMWYAIYRASAGAPRLRAYLVLLGVGVQALNWGLRPHLLTLVSIALTILLIPHRRWHWLYPLLFLVWANLHGGVAFGGAILATACITALAVDRAQLPHWLMITALSAAATLINPLDIGLWTLVLHTLDNPILKLTTEWRAPSLTWPASYPFFALAGITVVAAARARHTWRGHSDWTMLLCTALFLLLSFRSMRHTAAFAIIAPLIASRAFVGSRRLTRVTPQLGALHLAIALTCLIGGLVFVYGRWQHNVWTPALSPVIVTGIRSCEGTLYNTFDDGGFVLWQTPERPVFVDNRQDPYPKDLLQATIVAEYTGEYRRLFDAYDVQCALVPAERPLAGSLQRDGWQPLASDRAYIVFRKP